MKNVRNFCCAVLAAALLAGCGSTVGGNDSSATWWKNNMRGYWYVLKRDATDIYRGVDRHFFNYDWDDPNLQ